MPEVPAMSYENIPLLVAEGTYNHTVKLEGTA